MPPPPPSICIRSEVWEREEQELRYVGSNGSTQYLPHNIAGFITILHNITSTLTNNKLIIISLHNWMNVMQTDA